MEKGRKVVSEEEETRSVGRKEDFDFFSILILISDAHVFILFFIFCHVNFKDK